MKRYFSLLAQLVTVSYRKEIPCFKCPYFQGYAKQGTVHAAADFEQFEAGTVTPIAYGSFDSFGAEIRFHPEPLSY